MTMQDVTVNVDDSLRNHWQGGPFLTICDVLGCTNARAGQSDFDRECADTITELRSKGKDVLDEQRVLAMRTTFRAMPDMDPTRYRPASESLIRRCLDKGFFSINPLVDLNNLLSVRLRIPLGIYDLESLQSSVWTYRTGRAGETYFTFSHQPKNAEGKLVLADDQGPFGSPVADSGRAVISDKTTRVAIVAYLPMELTASIAGQWGQQILDSFSKYFHPSEVSIRVVE
jgi:DNA/RNA-binding domain of Phe-tRNA-synthetase-like protein